LLFKIPKQFELMGQTVYVEWVDDLQHDKDAFGTANFRDNKICLQRPTKTQPLPKDKMEHIFFHELAHWIMHTMGQQDLMVDEVFIDNLGGLLYQSIKTSKGELRY